MDATPREILALAVMEKAGLLDWFFAITDDRGTTTCRPKRKLITATKDVAALESDNEFVALVQKACEQAKLKTHVFHDDGEFRAECKGCFKYFYRREVPSAEHICAACRLPLKFL